MPDVIANRFEILRPLGSGGLSDVSLVRDRRDGETRALKRLRLEDAESVERFQAEFAELAALAHPNIVVVREYGTLEDGGRWIAMEAIDGRPADQAVRPGDVTGALRVALDAIAGLDALHAAGRFHGDVKPSNLLVDATRTVLIDFGFMGRENEMPGGRKRGTPGYLAPEVLRGAAPYGRASDAYALGASLYRILSGRPAFPGRDAAAILAAQARGVPPAQPLENAGVPRRLAELVLQLLSEDPETRVAAFDDLRELAQRRLERGGGAGAGAAVERAVLATSGPLVGRETERKALVAHLLNAGGSPLRIALVAGPVGSGRTRLAHEIAIAAELAGWSLEWHDLKRLPQGGEGDYASADSSSSRGTLYVLDDVDEWPESVLEALRPKGGETPIAILATARSERQEGQPFLRWSLGMSDSVAPHVFALGILSPEQCRELVLARLGGSIPEELDQIIARESSGWPGAVTTIVSQLVESGAIRRHGSEWTLPPGELLGVAVRNAAAANEATTLDRLSDAEHKVLVAMAGWIESVDESRLAEWTGLEKKELEVAIDALEWQGLISRISGTLHIASPLLQRRVLDSHFDGETDYVRTRLVEELARDSANRGFSRFYLKGCHAWVLGNRSGAIKSWRQALELNAADETQQMADLTRFVEASELDRSEDAARLVEALAQRWQSVNRPATAERLWKRASELDPSGPDFSSFKSRCLVERARCLYVLTRHAQGIQLLDQLLDIDEVSLSRELRAEALAERAWGRAMLGQASQARADWAEALQQIPEAPSAARVLAQNRLSTFLLQWGEIEEARSRLSTALSAAMELRDPALEARVRANIAQLAASEGRYEDSRENHERALELTRQIPNAFWLPIFLTNISTVYAQLGDWTAWDKVVAESISLARGAGDVSLLCGTLAAKQSLAVRRGRLSDARRNLRAERAWLRFSGRPDQHAHFRIMLGIVRGLMNQEQTAYRTLSAAHRAAEARRHPISIAQSGLALGDLFLRANRTQLAADWYERVIASGYKGQNLATLAILGLLRVAMRRRDAETVRKRIGQLETALLSAPPLETPAIREEAAGALASCDSDSTRAGDHYSRAVHALLERDLKLRAIETGWEASRALAAMGDRDRAKSFLMEAWQIAASSEIDAWKSRLAIELASGRTVSEGTQAPDGAPLARELLARVAELMNSLLDYSSLIQNSLELVARHMNAERGYILLVASDTGEIRTVSQFGPVTDESQENALTFSRSIVRRVAASGESFRADDAATDPRLGSTQSVLEMATRSVLCTPLRIREELIGTVYLESRTSPSQFDDEDLELLDAFSNLLAIAIDNSRKYEALRRSRERVIGTNLSLRNDVGTRYQAANIIGRSAEIERVLNEVELIANSRGTVLITGESGTGKELIAKTIHYNSPRREQPFQSLNCAALPTDLIEAELFGIESHAATGVQGRPGIFERADKGTLFLDEIGDMPLGIQAKLLRVLQEREFVRVGTTGRVVRIDVRLIAATNQDLPQLIREGRFREDLFFRLHALPIHIAPLRERKADIIPLAEHFLQKFCEENGRPLPSLSPEFKAALLRYGWPGNVRELQHNIERAVVMSPGSTLKTFDPKSDIGLTSLTSLDSPPSASDLKSGESLKEAVERFETRVIRRALERAKWNQRQAARDLGLVEPTLRYRMSKLAIEPPSPSRRK
jgi:Nif-specific regulatory protein